MGAGGSPLMAIVLVPVVRVVPSDSGDPIERSTLGQLASTVTEPTTASWTTATD